jgi:hypothetical protein
MLFDLKGRRRRVVQVTYLGLAILMGGGLVLFGIGGDVSGGLFDAFSDRSGSTGGNTIVEKRVDSAERRLATNPKDEKALRELARSSYQLAGGQTDPNTGRATAAAKPNLNRSARAWERYLALEPEKPDPALARVMIQVYNEFGLNKPDKATQVAEILADADPIANNFLTLSQYARLAGQTRKAELAGKRAIEVAPKAQKKQVRANLKQFEAAAAQQAAQKAQQQQQPQSGGLTP